MTPGADRRHSPASAVSFDRIAGDYDRSRGGDVRGRDFADSLAEWLHPGLSVEVGVGTAIVAAALAARGRDVIGIDISAEMLARARSRLGSRIARADACRLPLAEGSVDNVYTVWVLQLVTDHERYFEEAARIIRAGGRVVNIAGRGHYPDDDDIARLVIPMHARLRADTDEGDQLVVAAANAGLVLVSKSLVGLHRFEISPNEEADRHERRELSIVWDLPSAMWANEVAPVIAALRALPEPDRRRRRRPRSEVTIFEKPHSATT